jgi:hypothetical protein
LAYWFQRRRFLNIFPIRSYVKTMSADGGHLGWRSGSQDIILKVDHLWPGELKNQPIRNKNDLWWPCLLTDRDGLSILYRGPSIDASCQVSDHLAKRFQRRRFLEIDQSETRIAYDGHVC